MNKKILYGMMVVAGMLLTGCKGQNEASDPEGDTVSITFALANEVEEPDKAPARIATSIPGDPGIDDFVEPKNLYFALWVETSAGTYMESVYVPNADWTYANNGIYDHSVTYNFKLPSKELTGGKFYVFAYASTETLTPSPAITFSSYNSTEHNMPVTTTTLATLQGLKYSVPASVTDHSKFFRSMYSTALSECEHNQMATSPTVVLRHTASRIDVQWECSTEDDSNFKKGLTEGSNITLGNFVSGNLSLFTPGNNTDPTGSWTETFTINEGNRYNGRYVVYAPMVKTDGKFALTVTSNTDNIGGSTKTTALNMGVGADDNFATWMRALWTIK